MSGIGDAPLPFDGGRIARSDEERALVKRRILLLYIIGPVLSFAALLGGFELDRPRLAAVGVVGFGVTGALVGVLAMVERRLMFIVRARRGETHRYVLYEGFAAVPLGLAYAVAGAAAIAAAAQFLLGASLQEMRDAVLARPGYALVPIGAFLAAHGLGFVIGFASRAGTNGPRVFNALMRLPVRLAGLILLVWGAGALAIGLLDLMNPESFRLGFEAMFGNPWPFAAR